MPAYQWLVCSMIIICYMEYSIKQKLIFDQKLNVTLASMEFIASTKVINSEIQWHLLLSFAMISHHRWAMENSNLFFLYTLLLFFFSRFSRANVIDIVLRWFCNSDKYLECDKNWINQYAL